MARAATPALSAPWLARRRTRSIAGYTQRHQGMPIANIRAQLIADVSKVGHLKRPSRYTVTPMPAAIITSQPCSVRNKSACLSRSLRQVLSHQATNLKSTAAATMNSDERQDPPEIDFAHLAPRGIATEHGYEHHADGTDDPDPVQPPPDHRDLMERRFKPDDPSAPPPRRGWLWQGRTVVPTRLPRGRLPILAANALAKRRAVAFSARGRRPVLG
jgi:hypothetical protein